jgi:integrase
MAKVFKRGDRWYFRFYRDGKTHWGSAGPEGTKKMAEDLMAAERKKLSAANIYGAAPERVTFGAYADQFFTEAYATVKSADRYLGILEMLKVEWKGLRLDAVSPGMIEAYKAKRRAVRDDETVVKELQVIKRLFKSATATGRLQRDPSLAVKKPKAPAGRKSWQPSEKFTDLIAALPEWLRPLALFCYATGARRGEALNLLWRAVDLVAGTITFLDAKAGTRVHYFNRTARALLESLPAPISDGLNVFPAPSTKSRRVEDKPTPAGERARMRGAYEVKIDRAWREACFAAGLADKGADGRIRTRFRFHDIRHQAGSDLRRAGEDMGAVQTFLGHKSPVMTQRYVEIHPEDARRASEALDATASKTVAKLVAGQSRIGVSP